MSGLWIVERHAAQAKTGVLKNAATNRDVSLGLAEIACLQIDQRFEAQGRDRHGETADRLLIRDARRIDDLTRKFHRSIVSPQHGQRQTE